MYRYHPGYSSPGTPRVSDYYGHVGLLSRTFTTIAGLAVSVFTLSFSSNCIILLLYYSPIRRLTAKASHNAFGEVTHTLHGHKRKRYTPSRVHGHKKPKPSNFVTKVQGEKIILGFVFWVHFVSFSHRIPEATVVSNEAFFSSGGFAACSTSSKVLSRARQSALFWNQGEMLIISSYFMI